MTKAFTQNDVLRYLYNETSEKENEELEKALLVNLELREYFNEMKLLVTELKNLEIETPDAVVQNILEFSRQHNLQFHQ